MEIPYSNRQPGGCFHTMVVGARHWVAISRILIMEVEAPVSCDHPKPNLYWCGGKRCVSSCKFLNPTARRKDTYIGNWSPRKPTFWGPRMSLSEVEDGTYTLPWTLQSSYSRREAFRRVIRFVSTLFLSSLAPFAPNVAVVRCWRAWTRSNLWLLRCRSASRWSAGWQPGVLICSSASVTFTPCDLYKTILWHMQW
jgi:hypothetical protein